MNEPLIERKRLLADLLHRAHGAGSDQA